MFANARPSPQQTIDIFEGSWASRLPGEYSSLKAGNAALFDDPRVDWGISQLAALGTSLLGARLVELGPLEGGHTYQLSKVGTASVTSVEAHREAFLKCLIVKETLGMEHVNFLYGDAVDFLRGISHSYDIGWVSGFLYHMVNPVELIELLCRRCRSVFLWTVYYDAAFSQAHPGALAGSGAATRYSHSGFEHTLHRHDYGSNIALSQFWGGPLSYANWMGKDEILSAFSYFGFTQQTVKLEQNQNGSALCMVARRP